MRRKRIYHCRAQRMEPVLKRPNYRNGCPAGSIQKLPKVTGQTLRFWGKNMSGTEHSHHEKPTNNGCVEDLYGTLPEKFLNRIFFVSLCELWLLLSGVMREENGGRAYTL